MILATIAVFLPRAALPGPRLLVQVSLVLALTGRLVVAVGLEDQGSLPLPLLAREVDRWVARVAAEP